MPAHDVEGAGQGINIFIPAEDKSASLDSVYFRKQAAKLEFRPDLKQYIGRFTFNPKSKNDLVFSSDPKEEYGNEMPPIPKKIPFELEDNECVVSYLEGDEIKYYKIVNVVEKAMIAYPSAPQNKQ